MRRTTGVAKDQNPEKLKMNASEVIVGDRPGHFGSIGERQPHEQECGEAHLCQGEQKADDERVFRILAPLALYGSVARLS